MSSGVKERALIPSLSECNPGLRPSEFNVIVLPETVEEKTKGGIILIDSAKDADKQAGQRGRLISVSPVAFDYAEFPDGEKPAPGDIVRFAKFAGVLVQGLDGRDYRIIKDRDVMAVETNDGPEFVPFAEFQVSQMRAQAGTSE
jgi:chaperonin GroES